MLPGAVLVVGVTMPDATDSVCSALHFVYIICMMYVYATFEPRVYQLRHLIDLCSNAGYFSVTRCMKFCIDPYGNRCRFALH